MKQEPLRLTIFISIIVCIFAIIVSIFILNDEQLPKETQIQVINNQEFILDKSAKHNYLIVGVDGKFGFARDNGEIFDEQLYDVLSVADYGLYYFKKATVQGFLDAELNEIFSTEETINSNVSENFVIYSSNNKKGFINITNGEKIKADYDVAYDFSEGFAAVQIGKATGFINTKGELVIPCQYSNNAMYQFKSGKCNVMTGSLEEGNLCAFYIDTEGNKLFDLDFDYCMPFSDERAFVSKNAEWYIIDSEGNKVGENTFGPYEKTAPAVFKEEKAIVVKDGKYGVIDTDGNYTVEPEYDYMSEITEGGIVFKQNGLFGYMNIGGSIMITPRYESLSSFKNGLAVFSQDHKYGVIDRAATVVVNAEHENISIMDNGLIKIQTTDNKFYYLNKYGQTVYKSTENQ